MWGEDIEVPEAEALPPCGQGPMTLPVLSHDDEICTPGAVMSGEVEPNRSPRTTVWPSAPIGTARRLSCSRPLEEKSPRLRSRSLAATEITQGAWLKGETLASASSLPELPAEKTTTAPRFVTAFVATLTGSAGSYWRKLLPQELLMTSMSNRSSSASMWS